MKHQYLFAFLTLLALPACSSVDDAAFCDGTITLSVTSTTPDPVAADLLVSGTASISRNSAIRTVTVGGIQAKPDGFNFSQWSVTVPFASLLAAPPDTPDGDTLTLPVIASPACGEAGKTSIPIHVNREPEIKVETLTLTPAFPSKQSYLPANGSLSALVTVAGNPESRGATAVVEVTGPAKASSDTIVLAGDGSSAASASVVVTATGSGSVFVTAKSGATSAAPISFQAARAPRIVPEDATIAPGQTVSLNVLQDAEAQTVVCNFEAHDGVVGKEVTKGAVYTFTANADLKSAASATLRCSDDYNQSASATVTAEPPPEAP